MSANPFRNRWYRAFHVAVGPLRLLGFVPVLVRSRRTASKCRVGLAWIGLDALRPTPASERAA